MSLNLPSASRTAYSFFPPLLYIVVRFPPRFVDFFDADVCADFLFADFRISFATIAPFSVCHSPVNYVTNPDCDEPTLAKTDRARYDRTKRM